MKKLFFALLLALSLIACNREEEISDDVLLAKVQNKSLYLSQMEGMFAPGLTQEDSANIIDAYINRWVKEAILMNEAEKNIPKDLDIDQLVRDYRSSLVRHNYEIALVEQHLDSTIVESELKAFYDRNKEQYQLETPIVRCRFIKLKTATEQEKRLKKLWESTDETALNELVALSDSIADTYILNDSVWTDVNELALLLPEGTVTTENITKKKAFTQQEEEFTYFFRRLELKNNKEIAPLSYIEEQAKKVILHNRKLKLLSKMQESLLEREMRAGGVQIFTEE